MACLHRFRDTVLRKSLETVFVSARRCHRCWGPCRRRRLGLRRHLVAPHLWLLHRFRNPLRRCAGLYGFGAARPLGRRRPRIAIDTFEVWTLQ
mmetsp:Transcript_22602/g.57715  ORF Transcript_22602/g.57715 Transcript_22602/m.57715 type:complete len:93 (-) Transcript_22602:976-1254(-)